ncbi:MAG: acetylxylan esterase [Anaerolineae bacterium]
MLNFISPHLAINYFLLAFVTIVGALQFVAARHKLVGLNLMGSTRKPIWSYLLATALIVGAFAWFFATTPEVFVPGLAGSELEILFVAAGICALAFTLLVSSALHGFQHRERSDLKAGGRLRQEAVSLQQLRGTLYLPEDIGKPRAAICVLPGPSEGILSPHPIVANLIEEGFIVLAIDWGPESEVRYPGVLGLLPSAVAYLTRRDEVNPERIGVLGIDLGGDLAIRAAGTDQQIAAVLAMAPFLDQSNTKPGLSILKEMSYLEAIRWSSFRRRGELVAELAVLDSIGELSSRPLFLVYGDRDGIVPVERASTTLGKEMVQGKLKSLPGEGHLSLHRSPRASALVARWFKENL